MIEPGFLEKDIETLRGIVARLEEAERLNAELLDRMGSISVRLNDDEMQNVLALAAPEELER